MSLSVGIVGFPNVGKSTLFEILTRKFVDKSNYPFCTIDPNIGIVSVFDERLVKLAHLIKSKKTTHSTIKFIDIAGLVQGASKGEGLGNKFLANIRETDLIIYLLRAFPDQEIINVQNKVDPIIEKSLLDTELALKDLEIIEKRIQSLEKEIRAQQKEAVAEVNLLEKTKRAIEKGELAFREGLSKEELKILQSYRFLSLKPKIYILNGKNEDISESSKNELSKEKWPLLLINVLEEYECLEFSPADRVAFGLSPESKINELIKNSFVLLGLITFFTVNSEEARAWNIEKGTLILDAVEIVHTDFKKSFIKADVISCEELIEAGGLAEAKRLGMIRTEGKDYLVQDGDLVEVKH